MKASAHLVDLTSSPMHKTYIDKELIFFHILVLQEYWVLMEIRILLKPVLGDVRIVALPLVLMNRLNKTESAVFLYCRFSLILKDPFFQIIYTVGA